MLEKLFESLLWKSRLVVLVAVIFSMAAALVMFFIATVDAWVMITHIVDYASPALSIAERGAMRAEAVTHVVEIVDGYLLGAVLLIFSLGLYELFISKIDQAAGDDTASKVLLIRNLDDLKNRLAKVILMILVVRFFESALGIHFDSAMNLLLLAGGIALIGLALYLSHMGERPH